MSEQLLTQGEREQIIRMYTEMGESYKTLNALIAKGEPIGELKTKLGKIDESLMDFHAKHTAALARLDGFEQALSKRADAALSFGDRVVSDAGLIAYFKAGASGAYTVTTQSWRGERKDIMNVSVNLPERIDQIAGGPRLPFGVRNLIPQGRITAGAVEYLRETAFTNNADVVAEGAPKPKSDKTFAVENSVVRTIAHLFKVSKQSYDDLPALASQIEANGIYGVQLKEDQQLLNGSGVAPQLTGFNTVATAAPAGPAGGNLIDAIGVAVFDLAAKGYMATGTVVNPADWGAVAMEKNSQGNYLFANPIAYAANQRVWGTELQQSTNQAAGTFLTGAFRGYSLLLDREDVNVQVAEQNVDDFEKNLLTVRIEERITLLIYSALAFEKGVTPAALPLGAAGNNAAENRKR